jgi:hypothetical protein
MQASVAETAAFLGDRLHTLPKADIIRPGHLISHGHAAADGFTRPPFAHPVGIRQMSDSFPLPRGRHHFLPGRSFSAALSGMASASSRFQLRVLVFQRPQPLGLRDVHPSEFSLPFVDAGVADTMLAAEIDDRDPGLVLLNPDDLFFSSSVNRLRFISGPRLGPERTSNWIKPEGQGQAI